MFPSIKFRLNEFQGLGRWVEKNLPPWAAWIVNAFLYGLEDRWIAAKASAAVEAALADYRASEAPPTSFLDSTRVIEKPSAVEGLDEITVTALSPDGEPLVR